MGEIVRKKFDEELALLNEEMLQMSMIVEKAIDKAVNLIFNADDKGIKEVFEYEEETDRLETKIQDHCLRLFLEQQPVATDLRWISATLKMITDMERIGDQARDIADLCKYFKEDDKVFSVDSIKEMAKATIAMVHKSIDAYVKRDVEIAGSVSKDDDVVDNYFIEVRAEFVKLIKNESLDAERIIDLIMITKYLERIADHAVNISRWIIFAIEGFPTEA